MINDRERFPKLRRLSRIEGSSIELRIWHKISMNQERIDAKSYCSIVIAFIFMCCVNSSHCWSGSWEKMMQISVGRLSVKGKFALCSSVCMSLTSCTIKVVSDPGRVLPVLVQKSLTLARKVAQVGPSRTTGTIKSIQALKNRFLWNSNFAIQRWISSFCRRWLRNCINR